MKIFLVLVFLFTLSWDTKPLMTRDLAVQNPDLCEGDILGIKSGKKDGNVILYPPRRWPGGVIPFVIDKSLSRYTNLIKSAMNHITMVTSFCISFKPRTNEEKYIFIFEGEGCYSYVGMQFRDVHPLSLGLGCHHFGSILHILMHAIGFSHEHSRYDRDDYLIIHWENIRVGMEDGFIKLTPYKNPLLNKFDYDSIMICGEYLSSKAPGFAKTMEEKEAGVRLREPYEKPGLSHSDAYRIKKLYGCA